MIIKPLLSRGNYFCRYLAAATQR